MGWATSVGPADVADGARAALFRAESTVDKSTGVESAVVDKSVSE